MNTDKFKQSAQKLNLNEREKADIDYALTVLEKVSKALINCIYLIVVWLI